jgi:ElaB/YqjD/DUF883 family membrane-anchored ribosome-binding protein
MMSSEQLERQTEQNRAEVELTIEELKARLTPGQIVDEILSYAKDGGRELTANLGRQITNNPLPVALVGAGLAWFMFGQGVNASSRSGSSYRPRYSGESYGSNLGDTINTAGDMASRAGDTVRDAAGSVRRAAEDTADSVKHAAESAGSAVSDTARRVGESASSTYEAASSKVSDMAAKAKNQASEMEQKALTAAHDLIDQVKAQPLMLVGLGLMLGAAIGAAFPSTDLENRVMGDTADEVKREAKQVASEQMDKAKDFAADQMDKAKDAAHEFVEDTVDAVGNGAAQQPNEMPRPTQNFG